MRLTNNNQFNNAPTDNFELEQESNETNDFIKNIDPRIKNSACPKILGEDEIVCEICNELIKGHYSRDPNIKATEIKWHMHQYCKQQMENQCDRNTPGLMSERDQYK